MQDEFSITVGVQPVRAQQLRAQLLMIVDAAVRDEGQAPIFAAQGLGHHLTNGELDLPEDRAAGGRGSKPVGTAVLEHAQDRGERF